MDAQVFGAFVQQRRKELGMNQAQLAEKLHVTAKAVSRWERGVGFPDIKLLQPLADALEITIVELMQSKRIEEDIPKETAAALVSETVNTIQKQEELSRKRKWILYTGYCVFFVVYLFLELVGREYDFEPRWVGAAIAVIGVFIWHWGSRALYCLLTGEQFFRKKDPKWYTKQARIAQSVFLLGFVVLVAVLMAFGDVRNVWRDLVIVICLVMIVGSGILANEIEQEES